MEALTLAALATLVVKIMSVVKAIGKDNNMVLTQAATWAVSIGTIILAAHAKVTADFQVFGAYTLGSLDAGSLILAGLSLGSGGSFLYDYKKARDNTDSATEPSLTAKAPAAN